MTTATDTRSVAIIGAGISGLAAAYDLDRLARDAGVAIEMSILEASQRAGGVIETVRRDDLTMELGPDSIVIDKPWGIELCREIGLDDSVIPTRQSGGGSFIARGTELMPVPDGFHLMAPSRLTPFAMSRLISPAGKLRMAADLLIPRKQGDTDESLADFVRRRLGTEALERIAQPMVGGIYTADPEKLSLKATMPRFIEMEQRHGSLIRAMVSGRRSNPTPRDTRGPRYDLFIALRDGLGELPGRLVELLPDSALELGTRVARVSRNASRWRIETTEGRVLDVDGICVAAPAHAAAKMLDDVSATLSEELAAIEYASSATVNLVFERNDVGSELDGFGFVVPAIEGRTILACTFSSRKYEGRSDDRTTLLRAFVGGALAPANVDLDDDAMTAAILADLRDLLAIRAKPREVLITRWRSSMPQYHVGHLARVDRIEREVAGLDGLALAGNAYRGTGIPDCIRSGRAAASDLLTYLRAPRP